jgi:PIN domain nuclease of toxin-antitoxin system
MNSIIATDLKPIVLDTHIFIWLVSGGDFLSDKIKNIIRESTKEGCVFISAITLWEIALLNSKNRIKLGLNIDTWVESVLSLSGIEVIDINYKTLIESVNLSNGLHPGPSDRIIVATARAMNAVLITRDSKIISWNNENRLIRVIEG